MYVNYLDCADSGRMAVRILHFWFIHGLRVAFDHDVAYRKSVFLRGFDNDGHWATNHDDQLGEIYQTMLNELNCTFGARRPVIHVFIAVAVVIGL